MSRLSRREFIQILACLAAARESVAQVESKQFVAYSMNEAAQKLQEAQAADKDFRRANPLLWHLGNITKPWAVVIEENSGDWILLGERDPRSAVLTLDDWVVALRARFMHGERDPGVTIDPRGEAEGATRQDVRFFGGIENTHFGKICYEADWLMKKIGLKLETVPVPKLVTYFDLAVEQARKSGRQAGNILSRFWFYPALNRVNVVDGLALLEQFEMGVFTEVMAARLNGEALKDVSRFNHTPSEEFARSFTQNYDEMAAARDVLESLRGITRLAGLAAGLRSAAPNPNLRFWLSEYPVRRVETPREVEVLHKFDEELGLKISGGVTLAALATRLARGDASALREIVAAARGKGDLVWEFKLELHNGRPRTVQIPDRQADPQLIVPLWMQATFLFEKKRYEAAITLFDDIVEHAPEWEFGYNARGAAYGADGAHERAIRDFNKAIEINPRFAEALFNRANACVKLLRMEEAIRDYTRALELNPNLVEAYVNRALALERKAEFKDALTDYSRAIEVNPRFAPAYFNRGLLQGERGQTEEALRDMDKALEFDPHFARAHLSRAMLLEEQGRAREAVQSYSRFLQYDQPIEGAPRDWREYARERAEEILKELALPPAYERSHGGVTIAERLRRIRLKSAMGPTSGR